MKNGLYGENTCDSCNEGFGIATDVACIERFECKSSIWSFFFFKLFTNNIDDGGGPWYDDRGDGLSDGVVFDVRWLTPVTAADVAFDCGVDDEFAAMRRKRKEKTIILLNLIRLANGMDGCVGREEKKRRRKC